jgi:hypothetical protein
LKLRPIVIGGFAGLAAGYFAGAYVSCTWLYPTSNLCGLVGVFYTAPAGLVIGAGIGWAMSRRH